MNEPAASPTTGAAERSLAPDLGRGMMLLLIVLSNSTFFLWGLELDSSGDQISGGPADSVVQLLMVLLLDVRIYPLFAFLFGYGMMQVFRRRLDAGDGEAEASRVLRRRSLALLGLGFVHAALLLPSDVLGSYGILGLLLGWLFLRRSVRTQLIAGVVGIGLLGLVLLTGILLAAGIGSGPTGSTDGPSTEQAVGGTELLFAHATAGYLESIPVRLVTWLGITGLTVFALVAAVAMLLGFLAARHGVLAAPERHRRLLWRTAVIGCTLGLAGGALAALVSQDVLGPAAGLETGATLVQWSTGLAGGLGYVALFALLAARVSGRGGPGPALSAVRAVGKRSLSCYLTHSLLLGPVLAAWGLGLGSELGNATMALYATGVWLVTVVAAGLADRSVRRSALIHRGPAEVLLRRLTYAEPARRHGRRSGR